MKFIKYHAIGNDYIVYAGAENFSLTQQEISRVCDRHYGIGADGILLLTHPEAEHFTLKIINPDGSEAEKSGNGLRIFSRFLWDQKLVGDAPFLVHTQGGVVTAQVLDQGRAVNVSMGVARFEPSPEFPFITVDRAIDYPLIVLGQSLRVNAVSMGNPHCVIFMDQVDAQIAKTLGPVLEQHPLFPNRTNVQFVKVLDRHNIQVEIWERGVGYTLSSGTSSCAAAAVSCLLGFCDQQINVHMAGGTLHIDVDEAFNVSMRGAVQRIAQIDLDSECFEEHPLNV